MANLTETVRRPVPTGFKNYLDRVPLTPELAAIRDDKPLAGDAAQNPAQVPIADAERELLLSERQALVELRMSPGWPVLMRLFEKAYDSAEKSAIAVSRYDPLSHKEVIAARWAYLEMIRTAQNTLVSDINNEVELYKRKTKEMVK